MQRRSLAFLHLIKLAANGRQSNFEVFGYLAQGETLAVELEDALAGFVGEANAHFLQVRGFGIVPLEPET